MCTGVYTISEQYDIAEQGTSGWARKEDEASMNGYTGTL